MAAPPPLSARAGVWQQDLAATGSTDWYVPEVRDFSLTVTGTWVGTLSVERSFDGGTTAIAYTFADQAFAPTANFSTDFEQAEKRAMWRVTFTRTSGTATVRFGQ